MDLEQRKYRVDPLVLGRLRAQFGWSIDELCKQCALTGNTLNISTLKKLSHGGPVTLTTIRLVANVFGIANKMELLHPDELRALGVNPDRTISAEYVQDWKVGPYLTTWERTANGLQFCIAKLQHRYLKPPRFARGKCYWLRHLLVDERERLEEELGRHPSVCAQLRKHPNIAKNFTATFMDNGGLWWVLDQWEEGETLAKRLEKKPLEGVELKNVMTGIAEGLGALHKERIVRRELSPRFVIISTKDSCPILTDFELAKLLEGKTVAPKDGWLDDPYRAIEVAGEGTIDERADIYSWGRIFIEAATGILPAKGKEAETVRNLPFSGAVKDTVLKCVAKPRSNRPGRMEEILKVLQRWAP